MAVRYPIYCESIGNTTGSLNCCYPDDQTSPVCQSNFAADAKTFSDGCLYGNCLADCQKTVNIYQSIIQDEPTRGNGRGPIRRFQTCANVPAMAGYLSQHALEQNITASIGRHIPNTGTEDDKKKVTHAVTECLTQTCRNARSRTACGEPCSAVNLLVNSTTPNLQGINNCLMSLCTTGYDALPYADADVVGVGVSVLVDQ